MLLPWGAAHVLFLLAVGMTIVALVGSEIIEARPARSFLLVRARRRRDWRAK